MLKLILVLFISALSLNAFAHESNQKDSSNSKAIHVLLFSGTGWYRHPDIPKINGWIVRFLASKKIHVDISETGHDINSKNLKQYDVIILNNSNELVKVFNEKQRKAFRSWYENGGGLVALHATLVRQQAWPWFLELAGCDFDSDSDFLKAKVLVDPEAEKHPTVQGMGKSFWYTANWTNHTKTVTGLEGVQVLLRVDESTYDPVRDYFKERNGKPMGKDHPIAWLRQWEGGRFFYTEFGHDVRSLDTKFGKQHLYQGILWAADKK